MDTLLLKGKPVADVLQSKLRVRIDELASGGTVPNLAAILVGMTRLQRYMSAIKEEHLKSWVAKARHIIYPSILMRRKYWILLTN